MNKEETIISFGNKTGFTISKDNTDILTGKVVVNGIEITNVEDWEKVIKSLIELRHQNKHLQNNWYELKKYVDNRFVAIEFDYNNGISDKFERIVRDNELYKLKAKIKEIESRK